MTHWHSTHVAYHDRTGHDELILDAVRPLFAALPAEVDGAYFSRHWVRGPHVRIHVRCTPEVFDTAVRPLIESAVGAQLERRPSAEHPGPAHEQRLHERLAELESEAGPLTPWLPNNTIHHLPYDRRLHVLRTEEAADQLAEFHTDTTPIAFEVLDRVRAGEQRLDLLISLMMGTAHAACPPISRGYFSYRSHAEGFFANSGDGAGLRAQFDRVYESNRDGLAERMKEVLAAVDGGDEEVALLPPWLVVVRKYQERSGPMLEQGLLPMPDPLPTAAAEGKTTQPGQFSNISEFHQALYGNADVRRQLTETWFTVYRVLLNYQYLFFSRLGVTPVERFMLCHLVARTVEDSQGIELPAMIGLLRQGATAP